MFQPHRLHQFDLNLLKVLEALYQQQSLTRAADVLNLTPSAVSHALNRLRDTVGDPLFVRQNNRMQPTSLCERLAPECLRALSQVRNSLHALTRFEPVSNQQTFRVGLNHLFEPVFGPPLMTQLHQHSPLCSLSLIQVTRRTMQQQLANGQVDLVIDVALPVAAPINHQPLLDSEFVVAMREDHPLRDDMSLERYLSYRHISVSSRPTGTTLEDLALQQQAINRDLQLRCQTYLAALIQVSCSDALLTLPAIMLSLLPQSLRIATEPTPVALAPVALHSYWHENSHKDPALQWFRALVAETAGA